MNSYFFDSSGLVKRYVTEVSSAWVRGLMALAAGHDLMAARISVVEVFSALVRRVPPMLLAKTLKRVRRHFRRRLRLVPISGRLVNRAMALAVRYRLRGYDAVQLAAALVARDENLAAGRLAPILISADADLNAAAFGEGIAVDDPTTHP